MKKITVANIEVRIYNTKELMHKALKSKGYVFSKYCEACVCPAEIYKLKDNNWYLQPKVAEMYLHRETDVVAITHECLHAATSILRRKRKSLKLKSSIDVNEERLAYTQGLILVTILKEFYPKKLRNWDFSNIELLSKQSNEVRRFKSW